MSRENSFQNTVLKQFRKRGLHCVKHNDSFTPGISDLSLYCGKFDKTKWIELKRIKAWPKSEKKPVNLGFEKEQIYFMKMRRGLGLVKIGNDVLLLGHYACTNKLSKEVLFNAALLHFRGRVNWDAVYTVVFI